MIAYIDFETYSEAGYAYVDGKRTGGGLQEVGIQIYATHPTTKVLCLAYAFDNEDIHLWTPGMHVPERLLMYVSTGGVIEAHNAEFEYYIWNYCMMAKSYWPVLNMEQLKCSAAKARSNGLPGKLEKIPEALGSKELKDTKGNALINLLSCPKKTLKPGEKKYYTFEELPEKFSELYLYCIQDVRTERDISNYLSDLSDDETELWRINADINYRGVSIDQWAMDGCIKEYERIAKLLTDKIRKITNDQVKTSSEIANIRKWLEDQGVATDSLDVKVVKNLLSSDNLSEKVREVLEIRQVLSSASVKKLYAIRNRLDSLNELHPNRIHDLYLFCGASRTGRFSGAGPQPQNLPRSGTKNVYYDPICNIYHDRSYSLDSDPATGLDVPCVQDHWKHDVVKQVLTHASSHQSRSLSYWKDPVKAISGSLRGLFIASPGFDLISSDYSAIEARVLAELAGEKWRQDVFRDHGKIYEMSGSKITGVPFEDITKDHHARKLGKVAELASGYGGWIGAWKAFGADKWMNDHEIKEAIQRWRAASPAIVEFWGGQWRKYPDTWDFRQEYFGLEGAAVQAVLYSGRSFSYRSISYCMKDHILYCTLPSGRKLVYRNPVLRAVTDRYSKRPIYRLTFMGWNTNIKNGAPGWVELEAYGGHLAENVTQAVARDIFTTAMIRIHRHGKYHIVLHTHDEITAEVREGRGDINEFEALMSIREGWFSNWPIKAAGGWIGKRYRK
jgi:DNA polymerase